jgi:3-hydroxyisobutyrate dehydrogenase-like beta-hydroxyacid dehydrogenase
MSEGKSPKVVWIGLGKMGLPMAENLVKAGFPVVVLASSAQAKAIAGPTVNVADSAREAVAEADIVFSMIPDDPVLQQICLGENGTFSAMKPGSIHVDMSTVSPAGSAVVADGAAKSDIRYLRAPVSGSTNLAESAMLTILASGPQDAYDVCTEAFEAMGKNLFYVGEGEEARYLKLLLNMMVGATSAVVAEALTFGERGGIDWTQMIDVISGSALSSPLMNHKAPALKERNFEPAFSASQMAKDFNLILNTSREMNVPMPVTAIVSEYWGTMMSQGKGDLDFFGLVTVVEGMAGLAGPEK